MAVTTVIAEDWGTVICTNCAATVSIERLVIGTHDVSLSCPYCGHDGPPVEPSRAATLA